ncbi:MAG: SDR family NAD(P)-dependent oxidoreductase, partial [Actinomycetota bacterium]
MDLGDKVALVTGGASGLGRATIDAMLDGGARVVVVDLPSSQGETVAKEIGARARFAPADVTSEADVQNAVKTAVDEFGALHVAVNCAGIAWAQRTVDKNGPHPLELFAKVVQVNLVGTFNVTRIAAAQMVTQEPIDGERGVIVNTASIAAYDGQIGQVAYAASKG